MIGLKKGRELVVFVFVSSLPLSETPPYQSYQKVLSSKQLLQLPQRQDS